MAEAGEVDAAIAEVQRMPGHDYAADWVLRARRYALAHQALDADRDRRLAGAARAGAEPAGQPRRSPSARGAPAAAPVRRRPSPARSRRRLAPGARCTLAVSAAAAPGADRSRVT